MTTTTAWGVELDHVTQRYGDVVALDDVSLTIRPGVITGLLGRNGSGKSTLGALTAAFRRPTAGRVLVDGEEPWENERVVPGVCFLRESGDLLSDLPLRQSLEYAAGARPHFSHELAAELVDVFELDLRRAPSKLSRGKRSAAGIVVGRAQGAPPPPHLCLLVTGKRIW